MIPRRLLVFRLRQSDMIALRYQECTYTLGKSARRPPTAGTSIEIQCSGQKTREKSAPASSIHFHQVAKRTKESTAILSATNCIQAYNLGSKSAGDLTLRKKCHKESTKIICRYTPTITDGCMDMRFET